MHQPSFDGDYYDERRENDYYHGFSIMISFGEFAPISVLRTVALDFTAYRVCLGWVSINFINLDLEKVFYHLDSFRKKP